MKSGLVLQVFKLITREGDNQKFKARQGARLLEKGRGERGCACIQHTSRYKLKYCGLVRFSFSLPTKLGLNSIKILKLLMKLQTENEITMIMRLRRSNVSTITALFGIRR